MTTKEPVGTAANLLMTTLAQEGLTKDTDILRTVVQHNKLQVGDAG